MFLAARKDRFSVFSDLFLRIHPNNICADEVVTIVLLKIGLSAF